MTVGRPSLYTPELVKRARGVSGIYAMCDPDTMEVRYVGRSVNMGSRWQSHLRGGKKLPVSRWVSELARYGKKPVFCILQKCEAPEKEEARWIAHFRSQGMADLNLHDGGKGAPIGGAGRCEEVWSVEGKPCALTLSFRSLWRFQRSGAAKKATDFLKAAWAKCETELERVNVQLSCFYYVQSVGTDDLINQVEKWMIEAAPQINKVYPNRVTIVYNDGVEVTP